MKDLSVIDIARKGFRVIKETDPIFDLNHMVEVTQNSVVSYMSCSGLMVGYPEIRPMYEEVVDSQKMSLLMTVDSKTCILLLDKGNIIRFVSNQFLPGILGIEWTKIRETAKSDRGISDIIFSATTKITLSLYCIEKVLCGNFKVRDKGIFPAELLFYSLNVYIAIDSCSMKVFYPGDIFLSFSISKSWRSLNVANLTTTDIPKEEGKEIVVENGAEKDTITSNSAGIEYSKVASFLAKAVGFSENRFVLYIIDGDFSKYSFEKCHGNEAHFINKVQIAVKSSNYNYRTSDDWFREMSVALLVCLFDNDDNVLKVAMIVINTFVVPDKLMKVYFKWNDASIIEVLTVNDIPVYCDVDFDNNFIKSTDGQLFVFAKSSNGKRINVELFSTLCVIVFENKKFPLSFKVLTCIDISIKADSLKHELNVFNYNYSGFKTDLVHLLFGFRVVVVLPGIQLGRTDVIMHRVVLEETLLEDIKKNLVYNNSNPPYINPIFVMVLRIFGSWRLMIDYSILISFIIPVRMPRAIVYEDFAMLRGFNIFSSIGLIFRYLQVALNVSAQPVIESDKPLEESNKSLSEFSTNIEHLGVKVLPVRLCNTSLTFDNLICSVLNYLRIALCGLIVIIFLKNVADNIRYLAEIFIRLMSTELVTQIKIYLSLKTELKFLGYTFSGEGIKGQVRVVAATWECAVLRSVMALRRLFGVLDNFRAFVMNHAEIAYSLIQLLRASEVLHSGDGQQRAFTEFKEGLMQSPILIFPAFSKELSVASDASVIGLGAILLQNGVGMVMPIDFAHRVLIPIECNYSVSLREPLVVVWALRVFGQVVLEFNVHVFTDDLPFIAFVGKGKFIRILEFCSQFNYFPGVYNKFAILLSSVCGDDKCKQINGFRLRIQSLTLDLNRDNEQLHDPEASAVVSDLEKGNNSLYEFLKWGFVLEATKRGDCARILPKGLSNKVLVLVHSRTL